MLSVFRKHPFLSYALFCTALAAFVLLLERIGGGYDDGGIGGVAFLLGLVWNVVAFPFYCSIEVLQFLPNPWDRVFGWLIGFSVCLLAEFLYQRARRRRVAA